VLYLEPVWRNFFENIATVQFDHRLLAITLLGLVVAFSLLARRTVQLLRLRIGLYLLLAATVLQVVLGITTLLLVVPIPLAAAHQGGAVVLLTAVLFMTHQLRRC